MPEESPETENSGETPEPVDPPADDLSALVRRTLVQLGDLRDLEERVQEMGRRWSKITPPPSQKKGETPPEQ